MPYGRFKISVSENGAEKDNKMVVSKLGDTTDVSFDLAQAAAGKVPEADESGRALTSAQKAELEKAQKEQAAAMVPARILALLDYLRAMQLLALSLGTISGTDRPR